jgi:Tfp pilus assembly protein PilF
MLLTCLIIRRRQSQPYLLVGWLWFLGTLVPVIGFVQVGSQAMADRYIYVPMIGIIVAAVWLLSEVAAAHPQLRQGLPAAGMAIVAVVTIVTVRQERYWHDDVTLFAHALAIDPQDNGAHDALGMAIAEQAGDLDLARAHFETALAINPKDQMAFAGLGYYFNYKGDLGDAEKNFSLALANTKSRHVRADMYNNLAAIALKFGDPTTAKQDYHLSLEALPNRYRPWANLGFIALDQKSLSEAREDFQHSIAARPTAAAYIGLARTLHAMNEDQQSVGAYQQALKLAPGSEIAQHEMQVLEKDPHN